MKTLVIGANGQLGSDIVSIFGHDSYYEITPTVSSEINITAPNTIDAAIAKYSPEMIISTAAFHNVDLCENDPEKSFGVNTIGIRNLSIACKQHNITLVHFSTDYVFGENRNRSTPYTETDTPGPQSVYAVSKLAGEYIMRYLLSKYYIIRTSGLYGSAQSSSKSDNVINAILKRTRQRSDILAVKNQILSPTYTVNIAENLKELLKTTHYGLYHMTSGGQCSWYEFVSEVVRLLKSPVNVMPVQAAAYYTQVKRPHYSVLENAHLKEIGLYTMQSWQENVQRYLTDQHFIK